MKKSCSLCGSSDLFVKKYNLHNRQDYTLTQKIKKFIKKILKKGSAIFEGNVDICNSCGYGVMENIPDPEKLHDYYTNQYWDKRSDDGKIPLKDEYKSDMRAKTQIQLVSEYVSTANSILEIGAGAACASLQLRDFVKGKNNEAEIYVCEPGDQWIEYYKRQNISRIASFFPFVSEQKFDYIHTSHWLEHVQNIGKTVETLNNMLNTGGYLFIEVPNSAKDYWDLDFIDVPHIHFFTKYSLQKLIENYGFECLFSEEFGVTFHTYFHEKRSDYYEEQKNGIWVRALFKKQKDICVS